MFINLNLSNHRKDREDIFFGRRTGNFVAAVGKQEKLAATKVKMSGSEKKNEQNTYDSSSIKRVTRKFLEVSRCCAKQRQRNIQNRLLTKKCAARAKLLFC